MNKLVFGYYSFLSEFASRLLCEVSVCVQRCLCLVCVEVISCAKFAGLHTNYNSRVQTFTRQQLDKLETYLGQVEIVRDGVLEVVLFPAPESMRLAVDDIHVRDAVRALKKASTNYYQG